MNTTFVDTSYLLAIVNVDDALHDRASAWTERVHGRLLTTEFVLLEFMDALCGPPFRRRALDTLTLLRADDAFTIAPLSAGLLSSGVDVFATHQDKEWSLTDCISFCLMRREGLIDALTADRHFEQAGFRALLRMDPPDG